MGGPTNTTPRYRPPPPGTAPPPPPPPSDANMPQQQQQYGQQQQQNYVQYPASNASQTYAQQPHAVMGGQGQAPNSFHQSQMQHQFHQMPGPPHQQQYQQPQQSNYIANQQYSQPPPAATPSYYTQQQAPQQQQQPPAQQQQPVVQRPPAQGSYAARSIAANSPHGSMHGSNPSTHGQTNPTTNTNNNTNANTAHLKGLDPAFVAEQTRLLTNATRKVSDASSGMNRAIEENDAVGVLEMACVMLEELGDPNHGVKGQVRVGSSLLNCIHLQCVHMLCE